MRLLDLKPRFLHRENDKSFSFVENIGDADGVSFLCPKCFEQNGGPAGTHSVICWQPHVPETTYPIPGRWKFEGTDLEDLTLVMGSSSVLLASPPGCGAHFYVRVGEIIGA
jgi:hypothetical protein